LTLIVNAQEETGELHGFPATFLVCSLSDMLNKHAARLEALLQRSGVRNVCVREELGEHGEMVRVAAVSIRVCQRANRRGIAISSSCRAPRTE